MIAVITRNSVIRPVVVLVKTLTSAISISTGGSVGRESPIVQIGAAISRHFHGNITEFVLPQFVMVSLWEFGLYLILCLIAGGIGFNF